MIVKYILRVTIMRKYNQITKECEILVLNPINPDQLLKGIEPVKSEVKRLLIKVGIEEWLHLNFEFEKSNYHLRDVVKGTVTFKKVSIRLVSMDLHVVRKETVGQGKDTL